MPEIEFQAHEQSIRTCTFKEAIFAARTPSLCSTRELAPALSASLGVSGKACLVLTPLLLAAGLCGVDTASSLEPVAPSLLLLPTMIGKDFACRLGVLRCLTFSQGSQTSYNRPALPVMF